METISPKEAAARLNISETRICKLLRSGRIKGACKQGRRWIIPLYRGALKITDKPQGPAGSWHFQKQRKQQKTIIHVNQHVIKHNKETNDRLPVFSVKQGKKIEYTSHIEFVGSAVLIYHPDKPLPCQATATLVTTEPVRYICERSPKDLDLKALQSRKKAFSANS